jgi:tetratricopeptide (TPR) repeat protein
MDDEVKVWGETVLIPTYKIGKPDKNPQFLKQRVYHGCKGNVYPYAVVDRISDEKKEQAYTAIYLENRYLKVMVLPELGGRIQMALNKTNGYHFIYYNRVIKPALAGLTGPRVSGGIEFNWPQYHRPSTFEPLDWRIDENVDGSKTVWCSEIEMMSRMKGMHGIRLYPEAAYIEVIVQLYNRTHLPQTFLWWVNAAVHANENTQIFFPPDVRAVMDCEKQNVAPFLIPKDLYNQAGNSPGTDISIYRNLPLPVSYTAFHSRYDFLGNYDLMKEAGMLHTADHHIVPGKKMSTRGYGDFGMAWNRQITDQDGAYIEIMCGAFSGEQTEYSWLMPGEEKSFRQYFYPFNQIGIPSNANKDFALSVKTKATSIDIGVYSTRARSVTVRLVNKVDILHEEKIDISPEMPYQKSILISEHVPQDELVLSVYEDHHLLLSVMPDAETVSSKPTPAPVKAPDLPDAIESVEELFLCGLHLDQMRHATYSSRPYYEEGLKREPLNYRLNSVVGMMNFKQGQYEKARMYTEQAIEGLTRYSKSPYDGEVFYQYGLIFNALEENDLAYDAFFKAVWNGSWQDAAYFELARLACLKSDFEEALEFTRRSLRKNYFQHKARHLRIAILRRMGQINAALREASLALELDRMEFGAMWERYLLVQDPLFSQLTHQKPNTLTEIALDYIASGMYLEAMALLRRIPIPDPMAEYYLGWCLDLDGDRDSAFETFAQASRLPPDFCFPNHDECMPALNKAIEYNPADSKAHYYLGNYYYAHHNPSAAINHWEKACEFDTNFATARRNLGIAYYNDLNQPEKALSFFERAFDLDPSDSRILFELDQIYMLLNHQSQGRLIRLESYRGLVDQRDDLSLVFISLLIIHGRLQEALEILINRDFHPWEGGEGKVTEQYVVCLLELAKESIKAKEYSLALKYIESAKSYPNNLNEGKIFGAAENDIYYYLGVAYEGLGLTNEAKYHFSQAAEGSVSLRKPLLYNETLIMKVFYKGLALKKIGRDEEALLLFKGMVSLGKTQINEDVKPDFFAVSTPDFSNLTFDINKNNRINCNYLAGLGYLGLGQFQEALFHFESVLSDNIAHQGTIIHSRFAS